MDPWLNEAREALLSRRNRMRARGLQESSSEQPQGELLDSSDQELRDIDDALARIEKGDFGKCSRCGGAIGRNRLRALPETRYCLSCSALVTR